MDPGTLFEPDAVAVVTAPTTAGKLGHEAMASAVAVDPDGGTGA